MRFRRIMWRWNINAHKNCAASGPSPLQIPTKLIVSMFLIFLHIFYNQLLYLENLFELLEVSL